VREIFRITRGTHEFATSKGMVTSGDVAIIFLRVLCVFECIPLHWEYLYVFTCIEDIKSETWPVVVDLFAAVLLGPLWPNSRRQSTGVRGRLVHLDVYRAHGPKM